ncbi:tandem-95 repeat protein, partial [Pseudomonas sp. MAP12]
AHFNGVADFTYTVTDGKLTSNTATVTVNVAAVNDAPVAVDDAVTVTEDVPFTSSIELDANDSDLDGDSLSVVAGTFTTAQGGTLVLAADGSYSYTPAANFHGTDSVDYTVTDGSLSDIGTLTITVTPVNDAPVAVDDAVTVTEDVPFSSVIQLDANDSDLDGDSLSVIAGTFTTAQGGTLVLAADGSYTYTPAANFHGTDSVDYTVTDGSLSDVGTLTLTVSPVNDAPVAVDDAVTVTEDVPFSSVIQLDANDSDLDGDSLSVVAGTFTTVKGGTLVLAADGSYTYTPAANFHGTDSVDYTVTDGSLSDVGTLTLTVSPVNDAPVAVNDTLAATEDTAVTYTAAQLLGNDSDVDGDSLSIASVTSGAGGTAVLNADGTVTFTPNAHFNGVADFTYTVTDGKLTSNTATVTVNVAAVNDAPVAVDDAASTAEDSVLTGSVELDANDSDLDGDSLSVVAGTFATAQG